MIQTPATPQIDATHYEALQQAIGFAFEITEPIGLAVAGSIIRGNPDPASDLDIVILHRQPWRRRIQRFFNGVPAEMFFNPQEWLAHDIQQEAACGQPVMAHMLATGTVVFDTEEHLAALVELARETLQRGPSLSSDELLRDRYAAACQVEDALDLSGCDTLDRAQQFALAAQALVRHDYLRHNEFLPRPKERFRQLQSLHPELYKLLQTALPASHPGAPEALREAAMMVLGTAGFFEWDSGENNSRPPSALSN